MIASESSSSGSLPSAGKHLPFWHVSSVSHTDESVLQSSTHTPSCSSSSKSHSSSSKHPLLLSWVKISSRASIQLPHRVVKSGNSSSSDSRLISCPSQACPDPVKKKIENAIAAHSCSLLRPLPLVSVIFLTLLIALLIVFDGLICVVVLS